MFQGIITFLASSEGLLLIFMGASVIAFGGWIRPMMKENVRLKEVHHHTLDNLPKIDDYERKFDSFKVDLKDIIARYEHVVGDDIKKEIEEHFKEMEKSIKQEIVEIYELMDDYLTRLNDFSEVMLQVQNDSKTRMELAESNSKATKYQFAKVRVILENVIMVNQEFAKFFMHIVEDVESKGVLARVNYEPLKQINNILVSINDEATKVMIKIKAEEADFEKMISGD